MPSGFLLRFVARGLVWSLLVIACAAALHAQTTDDGTDGEDDPVKIFNRAQDAHAKGDLARAVELYTAAIGVRPEFPEAEYQKGVALISLKRTAEAEKSLRRAAELRPNWSLPQTALGLLLVRAGDDAKAEPFLRRAVELDPKDANALAALASLRLRAGAKDEAVKLIQRATTGDEANAAMWATRASIERAAGDKTAAAASIERALKLDPNNVAAIEERTELAADTDDYERAIADVESALRAAPQSKQLLARLANYHALAGEKYRTTDPNKSLEHYRRAAELEPSSIGHATGYASALVQARRFAEAAALLRRILESAPDNYAAHANLATALDGLKQYPDALVEYKWLNRARPELAVTYFLLARAYDLTGDYELALETYETFLAKADAAQNGLEMEKVNLRLPNLRRQIKNGQGAKRKKN
ncbi:MAG TPA: tetratricopeptide repeat protein [Pyrinomonadaceae bacterium]|nr:tetratricopeptide repeat protein [Pyrinomonadaceae bacterium]